MARRVRNDEIDLDKEVFLLADGTRLTEALAEKLGRELADQLWAEKSGTVATVQLPTDDE